ncbi:transposase [Actinosynnema sp. NPDC004786]
MSRWALSACAPVAAAWQQPTSQAHDSAAISPTISGPSSIRCSPDPSWLSGRGGRPEKHYRRLIVDANLDTVDNGIEWRALPADFSPWNTVYQRHILVDTMSLPLAVLVTPANIHDKRAARSLLRRVRHRAGHRLTLIWADNGYHGTFPTA